MSTDVDKDNSGPEPHPDDESFQHAAQRPTNEDSSLMSVEEIEEAREKAQERLEAITRMGEAAAESEQDTGPRRLAMPLNNNERRISAMKLANLFDDLCWSDDETLRVHRFKEFAHAIADAVAKSLYE